MKFMDVILTANSTVNVPLPGRYFRIITGAGRFQLDFFGNGVSTEMISGLGVMLETFTGFSIRSATAQTITVAVSPYLIDDNRLAGEINVTGSLSTKEAPAASASFGAVAVGIAATQIVAANTSRRSVLVQNKGAASVYVGPANTVTTATGIEVASGGSLTFTCASALFGISGTAGQDVRYLDEVN